jgi:hypothetical protein
MHAKRILISCVVAATLSGMHSLAQAKEEHQTIPGSRISFAPLPLEISFQPGQKPAIVFSTPCIQIEKMTNGFPPILAFENFMFDIIGRVNDSELLPVRLEPVCI